LGQRWMALGRGCLPDAGCGPAFDRGGGPPKAQTAGFEADDHLRHQPQGIGHPRNQARAIRRAPGRDCGICPGASPTWGAHGRQRSWDKPVKRGGSLRQLHNWAPPVRTAGAAGSRCCGGLQAASRRGWGLLVVRCFRSRSKREAEAEAWTAFVSRGPAPSWLQKFGAWLHVASA